jgi:hypothetical protein
LISCVAKGENLVQTWLHFAWFFAFFASFHRWFCLKLPVSKGRKPRSDLSSLCLIFAIGGRAGRGQNLIQNRLHFGYFWLWRSADHYLVAVCGFIFLIIVLTIASLILDLLILSTTVFLILVVVVRMYYFGCPR